MPSEKIKNLEELKAKLHNGKMSVLIGAGFSKNANGAYPNWDELLMPAAEELYMDEFKEQLLKKRGKSQKKDAILKDLIKDKTYFKVVADYIKRHHYRESIDVYIENYLKKVAEKVKKPDLLLHKLLLGLPWNDVFTTNYDTLLEEAEKTELFDLIDKGFQSDRVYSGIPKFGNYQPVTKSSDLSLSKNRRIVKLHGSLREEGQKYGFDNEFNHQYIIAEEDFREYGDKHKAFSHLMELVLLQENICLVGFSAEDPNFLEWVKWVKDIFEKETDQKDEFRIYFVDVNCDPLDAGKKQYFQNNRICRIELCDSEMSSILDLYKHEKYKDVYKQRIANFLHFLFGHKTQVLMWSNFAKSIKDRGVHSEGLKNSFSLNNLLDAEGIREFLLLAYDVLKEYPSIEIRLRYSVALHFAFISYYLPFELFYTSEQESVILDVFRKIKFHDLNDKQKQDFFYFELLLLYNDGLFDREEDFKKRVEFLEQNTTLLSEYQVNYLKHEKCRFYFHYFRIDEFQNCLQDWKPEDFEESLIWIIRKAVLLKELGDLKEAVDYLLKYEYFAAKEPIEIRLIYYEVLHGLSFPLSFEKDDKYKNIENQSRLIINDIECQGYKPMRTIFKDYLRDMKKMDEDEIKSLERARFQYSMTVQFGSNLAMEKTYNAFKIFYILYNLGLPLNAGIFVILNKDEWYSVQKYLFKIIPLVTLRFLFGYSDIDLIRHVGQEYIQSEEIPIHKLENIFNLLSQEVMRTLLHGRRVKRNKIMFLSEFFVSLDRSIWQPFYKKIWKFLHTQEGAVFWFYSDITNRTLYDFVVNGLKYINDKKLMLSILTELLSLEGESQKVKLNYLHILNVNVFYRHFIKEFQKDKHIESLLDTIIESFGQNPTSSIWTLNNIYELLSQKYRKKINDILLQIEHLENVFKPFPEYYYSLVLFSFGNTTLYERINTALQVLSHKEIWPTGIMCKDGNYARGFGTARMIKFSDTYHLLDFPAGINLEEKTIKHIYDSIKQSIILIRGYVSYLDQRSKLEFREFGIVHEMYTFLIKYENALQSEADYIEIKKMVMNEVKRELKADDFIDAVLSEDKASVLFVLNYYFNRIENEQIPDAEVQAFIRLLMYKIMFMKEPALSACIQTLSELAKYFFKLFESNINELIHILKIYHDNRGIADKMYIRKKIIRIASILNEHDVQDKIITFWLRYKGLNRFHEIREFEEDE